MLKFEGGLLLCDDAVGLCQPQDGVVRLALEDETEKISEETLSSEFQDVSTINTNTVPTLGHYENI